MCGIFGALYPDSKLPADTAAQLKSIIHRGPDEQGYWSDGHVFLGNCRLSIIDLAGGHQPIFNEDRTACIVYNGELYNFRDLRPQLEARGHVFQTDTDTEVILHGYEEWGVECLKHLNGMFAFAIWDEPRKQLFIARDRIGEKPLYYYRDREKLVFASEIKAILADPAVPRDVHLQGLANYLTFGRAAAPQTIYQNIYKLLPGHYLLANKNGIETKQYWDIGVEPQISSGENLSEAGYAKKILELLDDSVQRRMIADVPVGAFLSGGVDSSAIVALMKQHATGAVKTFSLGFTIGGAYNELSEAKQVAAFLNTEHHELQVEHVDLIETLQKLIYHYDEPFGDPAGFPVYLLSRFAREHVKVVLAGDGGDELFGGYRRYAADQMATMYQRLPSALTNGVVPNLINKLPRLRRSKRSLQALTIADPGTRYAAWFQVFTPEMQRQLLPPNVFGEIAGYDPTQAFSRHYDKLNGNSCADHLNRLMYIDVKTLLADTYMEKVDKAMMACSLEGRLPFLDHRLVELAFQIPGHYKIRGWSTKRILKRAVRELIPQEVLQRRKHGFAVPTDPWFRGELKDFTFEVLMDERTRRRGFFDLNFVEHLWREHLQGRNVWDTQLWLLLNFELWARTFLDKPVS